MITVPHAFTFMRIVFSHVLTCALLIAGAAAYAAETPSSSELSLVSLGKRLFFDAQLSRDGTMSCASCHQPAKSYSDGREIALGIAEHRGTRNTPSLITARRDTSLFWDGRRSSLEDLVLDPVTNPFEMGLRDEKELIARLSAATDLTPAFSQAFPNGQPSPTSDQVRSALAAFVRSLDVGQSLYDRYQSDPNRFPLDSKSLEGLRLFQGKAGCSECHRLEGPRATLTDGAFHHTSIGWPSIERNLPSLTRAVLAENLSGEALGRRVTTDPDWAALGRFLVTHKPTDIGAFRTPSLRNVALTPPYMHDGSIASLADAVDVEVYYRSLTTGHPSTMTVDERKTLVAFLQALTDLP